MAKRKYTVAGTQPAYDTQPGGVVELDESDHHVQANVAAGVLEPAKASGGAAAEKQQMTCPLCVERELKQPPKFDTHAELVEHYEQRHEGFVIPDWRAE